ncbi:MAG: hydrogenase nickel incorporation protein HypA [Dehalococcoidales bacterium]|nr:hydrogenase nickel incorporation protein HypA [Dehalococcoidales bacterium]
MHEWHITEELLDKVCVQAKENGLTRIRKVQVALGEDSHITNDSLCFCFQMLSEKTIARGAELAIKSSPGAFLDLLSFEGE